MQQQRRRMSLILIPPGHSKVWRWELKSWCLKALGMCLGALLVGGGLSFWGFIYYRDGFQATEAIRVQNAGYNQERAEFLSRLSSLENEVEQAHRLVARLEAETGTSGDHVMTEGIGPITEVLDLPDPTAGNALRQFRLNDNESVFSFGEVEQKMASLQDTVNSVEDRLSKLYRVRKQRNQFWSALPSVWPVRGWVTSGFGPRRATRVGGTRFHEGIDIAAPVGTPVLASGDGVVTFAGWKGGYGRCLVVDHGFGITSLYAHNAVLMVEEGQRVRRGLEIAAIGVTGRTTGPHLHYSVEVDGVPVDPLRYLAGR